jgi:hypothetical protein
LARFRHRGYVAAAVTTEFAVIAARAAPAIARRIPIENKIPGAKERKENAGRDALFAFHDRYSLLHQAGDYKDDVEQKQRYINIFGDPTSSDFVQSKREHDGLPFWNVEYLGKGWNSFALSFKTLTGKWVIKVGNPFSPNPYFFVDESNPKHSTEMQININSLNTASEKAGLENFVPLPQEITYLPTGKSASEQLGVTMHVMPFVESVSSRDLRDVRKNKPQQFARLVEEIERLADVRHNLQLETLSELDLNGHGNVGIVWKIDDKTKERYPGIQIIDAGLRYYGLETHVTDAYFDLTGFLQGVRLRRRIRGKIFQGLGKDLEIEWAIMHEGQKQRAQLNEASRRARRIGDDTILPNTGARQRRGMVA